MRRFWTHVAALIGGLAGFYAGLAVLLAAGGLDSAGWAPLFMCTGAGLVAGTVVTVVSPTATRGVWMIGSIGGLTLGAFLTAADPDLTVVAVLVALASQALAWLPHHRDGSG